MDLTPDGDYRLPECTNCHHHPMHPHNSVWKCPKCASTLTPNVRDPWWPWETEEEAEERHYWIRQETLKRLGRI